MTTPIRFRISYRDRTGAPEVRTADTEADAHSLARRLSITYEVATITDATPPPATTPSAAYRQGRPVDGDPIPWRLTPETLPCGQCGRLLSDPACGPTHALLAAVPAQHYRYGQPMELPVVDTVPLPKRRGWRFW